MKGAILKKQKIYYTDMKLVFQAMNNVEVNYNWLISDYECNIYKKPLTFNRSDKYVWMTGDELSSFVKENDIQFIWGAFTAFEKDIAIEEILKYEIPKSNKAFFANSIMEFQHPLSIMEIIAIDSTLVFIVSQKDNYIDEFLTNLPLAEDLSIHIKGR